MSWNRAICILFFLLDIISPVFSNIRCGVENYCYENWSYCCGLDLEICCYYSAYNFWWFWFIWIFVLIGIVSCGYYCCRRRRAQMRYYLVPNSSAPSYGTVVVDAPPAYPATQHQITATAPMNPPQYQPAEKPPVYAP